VLLIEDNPGDVKLIEIMLLETKNAFFELVHEKRLSDGSVRLREGDIDIVLLDLNLPDSPGVTTLYLVHETHPDIPIIVFTMMNAEKIGEEAKQIGADDFLVKGEVDSEILSRSILYAIEKHRLKTQIALYEKKICVLKSIIGTCSNCNKIRINDDLWLSLDELTENFNESVIKDILCPDCIKE